MASPLSGRYVLGYDARKLWEARFSAPEARKAFLFRLDVEGVRSVDTATWPSVFPSDGGARPEYVGFFQHLWEDLNSLRLHLAKSAQIRTRPSDVIAVTLVAGNLESADVKRWEKRLKGVSPTPGVTEADLSLPHASPAAIDAEWPLLGYDVCDEWGLSGLTDCGFHPDREDVQSLRATWGPRLNRFHLFDSIDHASEFARLSNQRVSEHAPFFVYGLWRVEALADGR
jgi:hypothetical protein